MKSNNADGEPLNCRRETDIIGSASPPCSLCEDAKLHEEGKGTDLNLSTVDEMQSSEMIGVLDMKAVTFSMIFFL